jgi:hypothetical protein
MIRRGLQLMLLVGITALGAASSAAQYPYQLSITNTGIPGADGNYFKFQNPISGSGNVYQRYDTDNNNLGTVMEVLAQAPYTATHQWYITLRTGVTASSGGNTVGVHGGIYTNAGIPTANYTMTKQNGYSGTFTVRVFKEPPPPPTLEEQIGSVFPDWASASVKIPLGFGFAMAFWAACLAVAIPMKWVKDLASAAS